MNTLTQRCTTITQTDDTITVNGTVYDLPEDWHGCHSVVIRDGVVKVNGYMLDLETGEFSRVTPRSFFLIGLLLAIVAVLYFRAQ